MPSILNKLPDPDIVGESLYRAVIEELEIWLDSATGGGTQSDIALQFAGELREIAKTIENTVKEGAAAPFAKGQRVEHIDQSFACYGTVKRVESSDWVWVLWDAVDDFTDVDMNPSREPVDALRPLAAK
jgi:hypothetical protein